MGVNNPGGGGGPLNGTAAARPTPAAGKQQLYWATDTNEITFSDGTAWHSIGYINTLVPGGLSIGNGGVLDNGSSGGPSGAITLSLDNAGMHLNGSAGGALVNNSNASWQATTATAGTGAAPPATVQGYFLFADSGGTTRKVPYYAN